MTVHDYYSARGHFATGEATKFTDSRNERRLRDFAVEGLQEVRKIVHDLKPEQMDKKQLDIALEEFFHEVQVNSGIDIQFRKMSQPSRSQSEAELSIFRGVQEAITNAMRHGQATRITVLLMYNPSQLVVTIKDNGTGAVDLAPKGGLKSLQERLRAEGGSVTLRRQIQV